MLDFSRASSRSALSFSYQGGPRQRIQSAFWQIMKQRTRLLRRISHQRLLSMLGKACLHIRGLYCFLYPRYD